MTEVWRPIASFEGLYEVSSAGRVRSLDRVVEYSDGRRRRYAGQIRIPSYHSHGYPIVPLCAGKRRETHAIHRLVATAFLERPSEKHEVAHRNGDPSDNRLENLRWATRQENIDDKVLHGTQTFGEDHSRAVLAERDVIEIIGALRIGTTQADLADRYGVCRGTISAINRGVTWRHIPREMSR